MQKLTVIDGRFRWASMQLEYLCMMKFDEEIKQLLGKLPPKLEELYSDILEKSTHYLSEWSQRKRKSILMWILCAKTSLSTDELKAAISIRPGGRYECEEMTVESILGLCCNFVVYDAGLQIFRFAHLRSRIPGNPIGVLDGFMSCTGSRKVPD